MKLDDYRNSSNVEDRRGGGGGGGSRLRIPIGRGRRLTPGRAVILLAILGIGYFVNGRAPTTGGRTTSPARTSSRTTRGTPANDASKDFVSKVLATTEDAWAERFSAEGEQYTPPKLVLFRDQVSSACGYESAAVGPFYCSRDKKAYLDLTFFDDLRDRFGSPGDFAQAYVVAHEIGHHVQNLLGISQKARAQGLHKGAEGESVRLELQADCFAGMWGGWVKQKGLLDTGDVDEALKAAQAIGDDTLQKRARGRVSPETFSHGTSAQRARWFKTGMTAKDLSACDTFAAGSL